MHYVLGDPVYGENNFFSKFNNNIKVLKQNHEFEVFVFVLTSTSKFYPLLKTLFFEKASLNYLRTFIHVYKIIIFYI